MEKVKINQHNYEMDFLKLLFMFIIVALHSENILGHRVIVFSGALAVEFFFLVSGYLLAKSADKVIFLRENNNSTIRIGEETIKFIIHKYGLIFPALLICIILNVGIRAYFGARSFDYIIYSVWELFCGQMYGFTPYCSTGVEWYLSTLFAASWIVFPMYLKNRDVFKNVVAPLITLFVLGWISMTYGNLGDAPGTWSGFWFKGMIRGIAEVSAGVICYSVAQKLAKINWTKWGHILLTIIEIICYIVAITYMIFKVSGPQDTILFLVLMIAVSISFSEQSYIVKLFVNKKWSYCAKFSSVLFFCHFTWSCMISGMMPESSFTRRFIVYCVLSLITTLVALVILKILDIIILRVKPKIKTILFVE